MIQEIRPHKLYNQYQADKVCQPEDVLICIKDKAILAGGAEHQLQFPKRKELAGNFACQYLFSLDEQDYYLVFAGEEIKAAGYRYETLRDLRYQYKGPRHLMRRIRLITWLCGTGIIAFAAAVVMRHSIRRGSGRWYALPVAM